MKRKMRKKSSIGKTLLKTIPLSVAMSLLAAGNAYAAVHDGDIVLADETGQLVLIEMSQVNDSNRDRFRALLKKNWLEGKSIFIDETQKDKHFVDFSKNARFGMTYEEVLAESERKDVQRADVIDMAQNPGIVSWLYN